METSPDDYFIALGRFISQFSTVDELLFPICQCVLGVDERRAAIVYYRNPQLGGRTALLTDLLAAVLDDEADRAEWATLAKRIEKLSSRRNLVAHNPLTQRITTTIGPDAAGFTHVSVLDVRRSRGQNLAKEKKPEIENAETLTKATQETAALLQQLTSFSQRMTSRFPVPSKGFAVRLQTEDH